MSPEASAPPKVEFSRERISKAWDELMPLVSEHFDEVSLLPRDMFNPDRPRYVQLDNLDVMHLHTMRLEGKVLGYATFLLTAHLHCPGTLWAMQDALYVRPGWLRGEKAVQFLVWQDMQLRREKVDIVFRHVGKCDYSRTLESIGYKPAERGYMRVLNADLERRMKGAA